MIIIYILSIIPLVIWSFMVPLGSRFLDFNTATTSIGQILGLLGMTLFSLNLILAGRFKFLDKYFKGLDKVYIHHSRMGVLAFSLLLFHPLFLVVKYVTFSIREAGLFFVPFTNIPITWGIISLLLMIILISFTFYIKLKYHVWKISHKFMTLAFFFAILHFLFIPSDTSRSGVLRYYILLLALVGLIVSIRQAFLNKFLVKKFKYKVKNVRELNQFIVEIEMEPLDKKMDFTPGQFAFFNFMSESLSSESHPFSISSSSLDSNLKITIKNLGDYTNLVKKIKVNDQIQVDGPYGNFSYKKVLNKNQIWIAGGIGITPFLSMAESLESDYSVDMYYSVKEEREAVHLGDLKNVSAKNPNFQFTLWITQDKGYIDGESILKLSHSLGNKDILLCGPLLFMESLKNQFLSQGVNIKNIHYENFSLDA